MNRLLVLAILLLSPAVAVAEKKVTYDLVSFAPPARWSKKAWVRDIKKDKTRTSYNLRNPDSRTSCQLFVVKSTKSAGDLDGDFASGWKALIVPLASPDGVKDAPQLTDSTEQDGWTVRTGVATFALDGRTTIAMLTTLRGYDRAVSIVAVTNGFDCFPTIEMFLASIEMTKPRGAKKLQALQGYMDDDANTKSWAWKLHDPPPP